MNPMVLIALSSLIQTIIKTYMDLSGKTSITAADLATKTPEDILKDMGIDLAALPPAQPAPATKP